MSDFHSKKKIHQIKALQFETSRMRYSEILPREVSGQFPIIIV